MRIGKKVSGEFGKSKVPDVGEHYAKESLTWLNMARKITDGLADDWFKDLGPLPISKVRTKAELADRELIDEYLSSFFEDEEKKLLPEAEKFENSFGELVPLHESQIGKALINVLTRTGIEWNYRTIVPIDHFEFAEIPELNFEGVSQWGTYFGLPFDQFFKVYRDESGLETCTWASDVLVATRPFEHMTTRIFHEDGVPYQHANDAKFLASGGLGFGQWPIKIFLPVILKWLFYLAETPYPANIMSFSRSLPFGETFPEEKLPKPYFINKHNARVSGAYEQTSGGFLASASLMPNVIEAGWSFQTTEESEIETILGVINEGLVKVMTILEDGYLNHRSSESPFQFDFALYSAVAFDSDIEPGIDALGLSCWVPGSRVGILLHETHVRAREALTANRFEELEEIAFNGVGPFVVNVINSLVFGHMLNSEYRYMVDRLLEAGYLMDVDGESTNALSNWGIVKYLRDETDDAIQKFELALERQDRFAEAEASYYLSKIWGERGNSQKAKTYLDRCLEAGGYKESAEAGSSSSGSSGLRKKSESGLSSVEKPATLLAPSKFCSQCGEEFAESARFCSGCGASRV